MQPNLLQRAKNPDSTAVELDAIYQVLSGWQQQHNHWKGPFLGSEVQDDALDITYDLLANPSGQGV